MSFHDLLSPDQISLSISASSKKRLLENITVMLGEVVPDLDTRAAFQALIDRERLGSTGVGSGVALPHGRLKGLDRAIGACVILKEEMDYDALDGMPIRLVFALLVPEEATEEHLQLLAQLARIFGTEENRERLLNAKDRDEVYNFLCSFDSDYQQAS